MTTMTDEKAREVIRTQLSQNMVVEAAAGTGKTTSLVERIIAVLASGIARVDQLVSVTFTERAAGELKLRIRTALELARETGVGANSNYIELALAHLEEARIGTIHSFCADLIRERPVEAQIDADFQVLTEAEAEQLYREVFNIWLHRKLQEPSEGLRRALRRSGRRVAPAEVLVEAALALSNWRDFDTTWRREQFNREGEIDKLIEELHRFVDITAIPLIRGNWFHRDVMRARETSARIRATERIRGRDYDELEALFVELAHDRKFCNPSAALGQMYTTTVTREEIENTHRALVTNILAFARRADADLASALQPELREATEEYEKLKRKLGRVDYLDLLLRARNVVRDFPAVREDFQRRFTHIFVDEFQDTDPLQADILLLLCAENAAAKRWDEMHPIDGRLFIVGDPKQSIYRFRRADVGIYSRVAESLVRQGAVYVQLSKSFRATRNIQNAINAGFSTLMDGDPRSGQAQYVPLGHHREDSVTQPSIVALPVADPYGKKQIAMYAINESLPDVVGAFIQWLLEKSGWTVTERDKPGERVPLAARHICILFRRFTSFAGDVTRPYVQALDARAIPHLLVGGKSYHLREEVETIRVALTAVEWPDDELAVFATLKGSLFAIGDEDLLLYRNTVGKLHPFRVPAEAIEDRLRPISEALGILRALSVNRNRRAISETISILLRETRAHAGFALRPSGEQVIANVLHLAELARNYERTGGVSFRAFVETLREAAEGGATPEAPILEEGSEGARLMTVHKAKGLEFPVVILADLSKKLSAENASLLLNQDRQLCAIRIGDWSPPELVENERLEIERDSAESVRLTYVAATRARDLLVVPVIGDPWPGIKESWVSPIAAALMPSAEMLEHRLAAPGSPAFGKESVRNRPAAVGKATSIPPGLYTFNSADAQKEYSVAWWDPHVLDLGVSPSFSLRKEEVLEPTDAERVAEDRSAYDKWLTRHKEAIKRGSMQSIQVSTVTAEANLGAGEKSANDVEVIVVPHSGPTPTGARYGTLLHAVLAVTSLNADMKSILELANVQGRIVGATEEEIATAGAVAFGVLQHPLMKTAQAAARLRRETPVTLLDSEGKVIEGVVDLAFAVDSQWIVVDFKTAHELENALPTYRNQIRIYSEAIRRSTGQSVRSILMSV